MALTYVLVRGLYLLNQIRYRTNSSGNGFFLTNLTLQPSYKLETMCLNIKRVDKTFFYYSFLKTFYLLNFKRTIWLRR